jgi:hypothetical protein
VRIPTQPIEDSSLAIDIPLYPEVPVSSLVPGPRHAD